ncbi:MULTISPECIES: thioredoxin family protein [Bacillaceae]|uniref:thioredoxin family protein n=1 Tax=Bacillaceae TaxID=186817 RepID=UPI000BFB93AD|nr:MULTISPECIES: thioredoxin family protein [Bacillaceae]MCM3161210.1 thioredoxin family protein [Metabacillus litoralis]MCM3412084.1 thioredoxin family protein [Metabacillus litoralis]PGT85362.1 thiol reductase thioredoxin [Bacillus sp. AFS040349]UGB30147.1 thioredoxin family protein [Metabacillus sp. B2-18]UHA61909.1 thioredoxin family protein [Metabacillus litoralis]
MIEWKEKELTLPKKGIQITYLYTPMCGTCQVAKKMLTVVDEMIPTLDIYSVNLNYYPEDAKRLGIESVPCLIITENGEMKEKVYAFQSVTHLFDLIKQYAC